MHDLKRRAENRSKFAIFCPLLSIVGAVIKSDYIEFVGVS